MDIRVCFILVLEALLAAALLWRCGALRTRAQWCVGLAVIVLGFALRALALDHETLDYQNFLSPWVTFYRENGGFRALWRPVGNYNIPYLYFMALFSYSSIRDLYLIKCLSILFDVLLAWGSAELLGVFCESAWRKLGCFACVLLLPTVILNGAFWGQCDSIYVALAVLALWLGLKDRPVAAMICLALSFGFKLQAIFVMPVFALLLLRGKLKWFHLAVFPAAYVLLVLPCVLLGRPFLDTVLLYANQTGSVGSALNYNSSSIFGIFWHVANEEAAATTAIAASAFYMLLVLIAASLFRDRLSDRAILCAAVLFAVGIPFFLPHMHDRYFFAADILTVVLAFALPWTFPAAPLTQFASLLGYHAYIYMRFFLPMRYGSWSLIAVLVLTAAAFARELYTSGGTKRNTAAL